MKWSEDGKSDDLRCVPLPPGRYHYRLVVDGQWSSDPHNARVETNPFGELNNLVDVK